MAYDEHLADRITDNLRSRSVAFEEKKMFGGVCYMVEDKMCLGIVDQALMARIAPERYESSLQKKGVRPMEFTGRPMKGYVFVDPIALDKEDDLNYWISLCLDFNPRARSSKKRS